MNERGHEHALTERLHMIFEWYRGMVDAASGRLAYGYDPARDRFVSDGSAIRRIASVWSAGALSRFLGRDELRPVIDRSVDYYSSFLKKNNGHLVLSPDRLGEPPGIAHSAFMIIALVYADSGPRLGQITALANGILAQQRHDGSYRIYFGDEPDDGLDLYPGEAMLALLEAEKLTHEKAYLESVKGGFHYYMDHYYEKGEVESDALVFFANWQSQFGRLLCEGTEDAEFNVSVREYLFRLQDRIIDSGFFQEVAEFPEWQATVEVACALEGLADTYCLATGSRNERLAAYRHSLCTAISYLLRAQCTEGCTFREKGGFGMTLSRREQRIDVTGHVANGFMKAVRNKIVC